MGSNRIDLKCSSQYVLTSLPPITKQSPTEGLVQAKGEYALKSKTSNTYYGALPKFETMFQQIIWDRVVKCCLGFDTSELLPNKSLYTGI